MCAFIYNPGPFTSIFFSFLSETIARICNGILLRCAFTVVLKHISVMCKNICWNESKDVRFVSILIAFC